MEGLSACRSLLHMLAPPPSSHQNPAYVTALTCVQSLLVSGNSSGGLTVHDQSSLATLAHLSATKIGAKITGLACRENSPIFWSCGTEGVSGLDTRVSNLTEGRVRLRGAGGEMGDIDVAPGQVFVACTHGDKVTIWDIRVPNKPARKLEDMHTDTVTRCRFHPTRTSTLFTSSVDGLCCVMDLTEPDNDEALSTVFNAEDSINSMGFFGPESEYAYLVTDVGKLSLWDLNTSDRLTEFNNIRLSAVPHNPTPFTIDYLTDCLYEESSQRLFLVSGTHFGNLVTSHVNLGQVTHAHVLAGGHCEPVRVVAHLQPGRLVTGGEDGRLCIWGSAPIQDEGEVEPQAEPTKRAKLD